MQQELRDSTVVVHGLWDGRVAARYNEIMEAASFLTGHEPRRRVILWPYGVSGRAYVLTALRRDTVGRYVATFCQNGRARDFPDTPIRGLVGSIIEINHTKVSQ